MIEVGKISGIGEFTQRTRTTEDGEVDEIFETENGKAFLVVRPKTLELRCDKRLKDVLLEKYETVMESRYFGKFGIEIVPSGQVSDEEIEDLVRLSYNLSLKNE